MSPIPSNRYDEAIFAIGIIKKVTGEKRQGGGTLVSTPLPGRPRVKKRLHEEREMKMDLLMGH